MTRRTITISESIEVELSPETLWAYVEDYANDVHWRRGLLEMTPTPPGPPRVGTCVHEVLTKLGRTYTTDSTVTEVGHHRYRFEGSGDSGSVAGGRTVRAGADGTSTFAYDIELELSGFEALIGPVVRWVMTRSLRAELASLRNAVGQPRSPDPRPR